MDQMTRIDARIPLNVRKIIDLAASLEGRTRTDFLIEAASEKARKVIAQHNIIELSLRDQEMLASALSDDNVKMPDSFLEDLALEYRQKVLSR